MNYKKGDVVVLFGPNAHHGNYGIEKYFFNREYTVHSTCGDDSMVIVGHGQFFYVYADMVREAGGPW